MKKKGLTLIELLAVIVVLGIIALIAVPQVVKIIKNYREESFVASLENLVKTFEVLNSEGGMDGVEYSEINVTDPQLPTSNKDFISGEVGYNPNQQIEVRYVTNGEFCAVGTSGNFKITEGNCGSLDSTGPIINNVSAVPSKYTVRLLVDAEDSETSIVKYEYSIQGSSFHEMEADYLIEDLKSSTDYSIIVRVTNAAGMSTNKTLRVRTLSLDTPTVEITPEGWTTSKTVTITYPNGYTNYYNKNGEGWIISQTETAVLEFTERGFVVAMITDGITTEQTVTYNIEKIDNDYPTCVIAVENADTWRPKKELKIIATDGTSGIYGVLAPNESEYTIGATIKRDATYIGSYTATVKDNSGKTGSCSAAVTKVDSTGPTNVSANIVSTTTSTIVVEGLGVDPETGITKYEFRLDGGQYIDNGNTSIHTFTDVSSGSHTVQLRVTNGVGLTTESTVINATPNTATLPTYSVSPSGWSTSKTVVVTYPTRQANYIYEYSTNGTTWYTLTGGVTKTIVFTSSGYIIARIYDGTNYFTASTFNVTQIDSTAPVLTTVTTTPTTNSIAVNVAASDGETGITKYVYNITGNDKNETIESSLSNYTFSGLKTGTYEITVTVTNGVGLTKTSTAKSVALLPITAATCSTISSSWSASKSVTLTYPTRTAGIIYTYSVNSGAWLTLGSGTTVSQTFTAPGTLVARVSDGVNSKNTTCNVTNVDGTDPVIGDVHNGTRIYNDPNFASSTNSTNVYNNAANGNVSISRIAMSSSYGSYALRITTVGSAAPDHGGFFFGTPTSANQVYVSRIVAKIPVNYTINFASNLTGTGSSGYWLTSQAGTGDWEEYVYVLKSGTGGTFSTTNFYYLSGGTAPSASSPLTWHVAYATVYSTADYSSTNYITLKASDVESGIVGYGINQSSTTAPTFTNITNTRDFVKNVGGFTTNGTYYVWVKNAAGRISNKAVSVNRIDVTPPVCSWATANSQAIDVGTSTTINLTCNDSGGITQGDYTAASLQNHLSATSGLTIVSVSRSGSSNSFVYTVTVKGENSPGLKTITLAANTLADSAGNYNTAVTSGTITVNPAAVTHATGFLVTTNLPAMYGNVYYQSSREGQNQMFRVRTGVYTNNAYGWRCDRWAVRITINSSVVVKNGQLKPSQQSTCSSEPLLGKNVVYYHPSSTGWTSWYSYNDTRTSGTTLATFDYYDTGHDTNESHELGSYSNHDYYSTYNMNMTIISYSW